MKLPIEPGVEILNLRGLDYTVHRAGTGLGSPARTLLALHGFTGSGRLFPKLFENTDILRNFRLVAPDLPGHGGTQPLPGSGRFRPGEQVQDLYALTEVLGAEHISLLGYSMGARLAWMFAEKYPGKVKNLILESCNPGIQDPSERGERLESDRKLAEAVRSDYPGFLKKWNRLPLFRSPDEPASDRKNDELAAMFTEVQKSQKPEGIAQSLIHAGTGVMDVLNPGNLHPGTNVLVITGTSDRKYTELWGQITRELPNWRHAGLHPAAHRVHLDCPEAYIRVVSAFLIPP